MLEAVRRLRHAGLGQLVDRGLREAGRTGRRVERDGSAPESEVSRDMVDIVSSGRMATGTGRLTVPASHVGRPGRT